MWFILSAGPAFDSSGQKPFYVQNSEFGRLFEQTVVLLPLLMRRFYVRRADNASDRPKPIGVDMTAEQIKLLAQMLKNGQAKLVEQKDGKLVPVSLI